MAARTYAGLEVALRERVLRIELDRPESLNALDAQASADLLEVLRGAAADPAVRVVVLAGRGRAFSAGADVKASLDGTEDLGDGLREVINPAILTLREMPKPVIAAVNGVAAGVGCSFALAADLVVAAESASFLLAFTRIGLTLDGGASAFLAARLGHAHAFRLALLAERIPARQAFEWGMVDQLTPDADHAATVDELATRLANGPTGAYAATKRALNAALYPNLAEQLELEARLQAERGRSPDFAEGVAAFVEKRPAVFTGA